MPKSVYSRTLQKAAELVGSRSKLCRILKVPATELDNWISGHSVPPQSVFLQAVDLVVDGASDQSTRSRDEPRTSISNSKPSTGGRE